MSADQCEMDGQMGKSVEMVTEADQACMVMNNAEVISQNRSESMDIAAGEEDLPATIRAGPEEMSSNQQALEVAPR
jgi:hypothetical protein